MQTIAPHNLHFAVFGQGRPVSFTLPQYGQQCASYHALRWFGIVQVCVRSATLPSLFRRFRCPMVVPGLPLPGPSPHLTDYGLGHLTDYDRGHAPSIPQTCARKSDNSRCSMFDPPQLDQSAIVYNNYCRLRVPSGFSSSRVVVADCREVSIFSHRDTDILRKLQLSSSLPQFQNHRQSSQGLPILSCHLTARIVHATDTSSSSPAFVTGFDRILPCSFLL